jgi:hypothetical protein
MKFASR